METSKYSDDFFSWTQEQAALLRSMPETVDLLDIECLADEVEGMGQAEIHRISSLLNNELVRLLKLAVAREASPALQWVEEITAAQSEAVIQIPPGLQRYLDLPKIWKVAKSVATRSLKEAGVDVPALPEVCPLTMDELLDPEFDLKAAAKKISTAISSVL